MATGFDGQRLRLVIPSRTDYLNLVTGLAKRASLTAGLDETTAAKVSIAVDEAVTNIILHAYKGSPDELVEVELVFRNGSLEVHLRHAGLGLRQDQVSLPDPEEYVRRPRKGGLGLLLMSRFMDEVRFFEDGGRNECCMVKMVKRVV